MAQNLDKIKKDLAQVKKLYAQLGKENPFEGMDPKKIAASTKESEKLRVALVGVTDEIDRANQSFGDLFDQLKATTGELFKTKSASQELEGAFKGSLKIVKQLSNEEEGLTNLTLKDLKSLQEKQKVRRKDAERAAKSLLTESGLQSMIGQKVDKRTKAYKNLSDEEKTALALLNEEDTTLEDIDNKIKARIEKEKLVQKNLGVTGGALKGIGGVLDKIGLGGLSKNLGIEEASKKAEEFSRQLEKEDEQRVKNNEEKRSDFEKKSMVMGKAFSEMGKSLAKSLTDPLTLIIALGKAALDNNKKIVDFQRVMGLSRKEAKGLKSELVAAARASDDMNVTTKALAHTLMSVQEQFGFTADFSTETLETATKLTKTVKLSEEAANSLAVASTLSSVAFEEQYQNALLASREIQIQEGRSYSLRAILEDVGKVTGSTRAQLGGSVVEITKAITQAKAFGASLEDVASAGRALLDFEDSITKELEAELLLGKDINLERARSAALMGDQATVAKELAREAGTFEEFGKMNVLQQEALAEAMGMTSDQLADILFQQEIEGKNAQELRALGKEELANRLEQQNAQEAFNASVEQLKGLFTDVMGFLEPILSGFTSLVGLIMEFKEAFMIVSGLQLIYIARKKLILALEARDIALKGLSFGKSLGLLVVEAAKQAAKVPIVGPALAVAAGAAIYSAFKGYEKKGDDVLSPGSNRSGYGNRVLFGPEGAISLNNKDTIIAGTNLRRGDDVMSGPPGSMSIGDGEAKKTNDLLRKVLNRPAPQPTIVMNDQELGTAINMGAFSIQ